jgi:hypothetical protein
MTEELDIDDVMRRLGVERKLFHSEADFQHALAWKIHELFPSAKIRLEVSSGRFDKRERIDILCGHEYHTCAIELKYKKRRLKCAYEGEPFSLGSDGAQDLGRYDFIKDIARVERYVASEPNTTGYAILLTNDDLYWRESARNINSAAFLLHEGRMLDAGVSFAWHPKTGPGTMKGRTDSFTLRTRRILTWKDYSHITDFADGRFRYLLISVKDGSRSIR